MKVQDMSANELIGFVSLAAMVITVITSDHLLIHAQTAEDSYLGRALKSKYNVILVGSGEDCIDKFIE